MKPLLLPLVAMTGFAAVDGTVINKTTGKPQPNATVTLYQLGGAGMDSLESVKSDAHGNFKMDRTPQGPHLIQTAFDGVTYNHMLPPGSTTTNLTLDVYNSTNKPAGAKVAQHMVLFEPSTGSLSVNEAIVYENAGKLAYNDPDGGTLRFYLPPETKGQVRIMAAAPQGMPVQRAAEKTEQPNIYKVDFPIKPGETRFDLTYEMPFTAPASFTGKILHKEGTTRLVAPQGVKLAGAGLRFISVEPRTQASIFDVAGPDFKVDIEGSGSLRAAGGEAAADDSQPRIQQIYPRIYDRMAWVLGLTLAILALGFVLFYRRQAPPSAAAQARPRPTTSPKEKRRA
jgi:hypothetical protein